MKKILSFLIIGFCLGLIFQACEKEPPELTVSATQLTIEYGATVTISWEAINATTCSSDIGVISGVNGSVTTPPLTKTTTYSFTATGPGGTVTSSIIIQVNAAPKPVLKVTVDKDTIRKGETINLLIESTNAVSVTVKGVTAGNLMDVGHTPPVTTEKTFPALKGTFTSWPLLETTQFTVTATGIDGNILAVAPPIVVIPTCADTLMQRYWMLSDDSKLFARGVWSPRYWTKDELSQKLYFYNDGIYKRIRENGEAWGPYEWNLVGQDSIQMAGRRFKMLLTDTTMVLSIHYDSGGDPNTIAITVYKGFKITP